MDTLVMLRASWSLVLLSIAVQIVNGVCHVLGILTAEYLNSVHRLLFDLLRAMVVWAFGLSVHYLWDRTSMLGEQWTACSYLQMGGFSVLIIGQLVYSGLI